MNPVDGISPAQAAAMFRRQKRQLERRAEMTDKCAEVAETLFQKYSIPASLTTEEAQLAIMELSYGMMAIQFQQLKLFQAEGKEQMADLEAAIRNAESPIITGPTHHRRGRG